MLTGEAMGDHLYLKSERIGGISQDGSKKLLKLTKVNFYKRKYNQGRMLNE